MPVYKWRRRSTKHFGEVLVPYAEIELQARDGAFQSFALQVDSGATVSLLRASAADVLGINRVGGRRIDLTSVGGSTVHAFVHTLPTRLNQEWPTISVPFAIAEIESVPNLLGRIGVFDRFQLDFDASVAETTIAAPWLDDDDRRIWQLLVDTDEYIRSKLYEVELPQEAKQAAARLYSRSGLLCAGAAGLAKLHRPYSGPLFIRALFEVAAQMEYLLRDPEPRGMRFLAFEKVTRYLEMRAYLDAPDNPISRLLRASQRRPAGEAMVKSEFDAIREQFLRPDSKRLWKNWYGMQFRQLIETISSSEWDWAQEHELIYKRCSGWAHAEPFHAGNDIRPDPRRPHDLLMQCYPYHARVLLRLSEKLVLSNEQYQFLRVVARGLAAPARVPQSP